MRRRRVKITGIGPVTPAGIGRESFWQGILEPVSRIRPYHRLGAEHGPFVAAYLESQHTGGPPVVNPAGWDSPHLWIGIVLAVGFFAAAVRLRRSADPI